jgi:cobalt-zinc-cadmium efflux system membrane fusion protein
MNDTNRLYAGAAIGLVAAAALGFGAARITQPAQPAPVLPTAAPSAPSDTLAITPQGIASSQITVAPAMAGELDAAIAAAATVKAVTRIMKLIGDPVRQGEKLALVESRDASQIAADGAAASARVTLAGKQAAREQSLVNQGVSARADLESAQANLAVAQADASRARAAASAVRLSSDGRSIAVVSPVTGRITAATAKLGQFVAAEAELFRVVDPRRLQVIANLPAADAPRVRAGDRVELILAEGMTAEASVRSATGVIDPDTRAATVVVVPTAGGSTLAPGQLIQVRIFASGGATKNGVMVPQDAVQTLGERSVVFVRTRSGFKAQAVQVGSRSGGFVGIASGLTAGTPIATTNAFLIKAEIEKEQAE